MKGALELQAVVKRFGQFVAVDGVSLDVRPGSLVALLGPSGCGKTTLLRCIAGLAMVDAGAIVIDGRDVTALPPWDRSLGMVFQNYALFPHLSVARNVAFGLRMRGVSGAEARERVGRALRLVQMEELAERRPRQLSGGQQQRVALARALIVEPPVLLLDEPLSALDAKLRLAMRQELRELQRRLGITTIVVTHDQAEAMAMADEVAVMRRGRIEQMAAPETVYRSPATAYVAEFIGRTNRFDGVVDAAGRLVVAGLAAPLRLATMTRLPQGQAAVAMVRPEQVMLDAAGELADDENGIAGVVTDNVFAGDHVEVHVETGSGRIIAKRATPMAQGDTVVAHWRCADTLVWPS